MVVNKNKITIDGIDYSSYAILPIKVGELLDERLDEASVTLRAVRKDIFKPFTEVTINVTNSVAVRSSSRTSERTYDFIVANDTATEMPVGSGLYNHELYLIERTKLLETIVVESITFRNSLKMRVITTAPPTIPTMYGLTGTDYGVNFSLLQAVYNAGEFTLPSMWDLCYLTDYLITFYEGSKAVLVEVEDSNGVVYSYSEAPITTEALKEATQVTHPLDLIEGQYKITYKFNVTQGGITTARFGCQFDISVMRNALPLKRITCKDVVVRLLDICEPIRYLDVPRFSLSSEQEDWLDSVYAPEFSFTRSTLRECLQEVGKILHAEPRLKDSEIYFDRYGGTEFSAIAGLPYTAKTSSITSEQYCTELDSSVSNIISASDWVKGVIIEPQDNHFKSVRTESVNVRIEDGNMLIKTDRPVYQVSQLVAIWEDSGAVVEYDITPYVFERNTYETRLSSYVAQYPYAKCLAIYYTQGQKNIQGLNFKAQEVSALSVFQNYAIVNILHQASGGKISTSWLESDYPIKLAFRLTYVPFYETRVKTSKPLLTDEPTITIVYNQSANMVDSRAYGENLKGAVARLGNVEKSYRYNLTDIRLIPRAGQLFDKDYYIANVNTEFLPNLIRVTIGLSKDFNRLSQYIGVSSERRYSEISEKNTYDRAWVYKQIIEVGNEIPENDGSLLRSSFLTTALDVFIQTGSYEPLRHAIAFGGTYAKPTGDTYTSEMTIVDLPVVSTAIGSAMVFIWAYEDNFSAGAKSSAVDIKDGNNQSIITGQFNEMVGYTDDYGKMYYYNFSVLPSDEAEANYSDAMGYALAVPDRGNDKSVFPSNYISTADRPFVYRKDSAEIPQFNFEVEFVSNTPSIMVGTGIAENNPLVRGSDSSLVAKLYPLSYRPNKFTSNIADLDLTGVTPINLTISFTSNYSAVLTADAPDCEAWVIASDVTINEEAVIDEYGNELTQEQIVGGQVLLIGEGNFAPIHFGIRMQNNTCVIVFSDRAYKIPFISPSAYTIFSVYFSNEYYQITNQPSSIAVYSVTMSDDVVIYTRTPEEIDPDSF